MAPRRTDYLVYAVAALSILLVAGMWYVQTQPTPHTENPLPPLPQAAHQHGSPDAPLQLYIYFDTDCPYCAWYHHAVLPALYERYKSDIAVSYLYLPLPSHPKALGEARMAECAAQIGGEEKFWPTISWLTYSEMEGAEPTENDLAGLAAFTSLPQAELAECVRARKVDERIRADIQDGVLRGVNTIPSTLVVTKNGSELVATSRLEVLLSSIERLLHEPEDTTH